MFISTANIISIIYIMNIFLTILIVFIERERRSVTSTWAWVLVLTFIPLLGFFLYFVFGRKLSRRKMFNMSMLHQEKIKKLAEEQKTSLLENSNNWPNAVIKHKRQAYMNLNNRFPISLNNHVDIMTDGRVKFETLLSDIKAAKTSISIMYYIVRTDSLGQYLLEQLINKAQSGVQVRLLYDFLGSRGLSSKTLNKLRGAGGEIAAFSTSRHPRLALEVNNRNHRKLVIIDEKIGYIGGFNVGEEYLGLNDSFGYWRDTHLRIVGDAVTSMNRRFLLDWSHTTGTNIELPEEPTSPEDSQKYGEIAIQIVSSGPDSDQEQIKLNYIRMITAARKYVYIQTPYFVPDDSLIDALRTAIQSGVDVKIMIPNKPDHPFIYWATWSHVGELIASGGKVYIYNNGFLHAKTIIVDDTVASVGTANIDLRSFRLNFEVNAILYHDSQLKKLRSLFESDMLKSTELTRELYSQRSLLIKIKESVSRLLSPIL